MNSAKEIRDFIDNIDCGEPVYAVTVSYSDLNLVFPNWVDRSSMKNSSDWLQRCMSVHVRRKFNKESKELEIADKEGLFRDTCIEILRAAKDAARAVSPAVKPKRTKAFQELVDIARNNKFNEKWVDDVLPIINYYLDNSTDSTVKKNVYGLFNILRKRYGTSS